MWKFCLFSGRHGKNKNKQNPLFTFKLEHVSLLAERNEKKEQETKQKIQLNFAQAFAWSF